MKKERIKENDFKQEERPRTRFKQFFDIAKHRFVELLKISLLQTVFNMPLIGTIITFYLFVNNATSLDSLMAIFLITSGCLFLSMVSSFVGLTGTFHCFKKMIYAEGEYASSDFFVGLVQNWKRGLLVGLIIGLSVAVTVVGSFFFYFYLSAYNTTIAGFGIAILVIQALVVLMIGYYSVMQIIIYENTFKAILKNSFIFTLMRFQYNLPLFILHPGIIIALIAIMNITMFVAVGLIIIFISFGHLMWSLNCMSVFDTFINKEYHPDYYKKGLYKED